MLPIRKTYSPILLALFAWASHTPALAQADDELIDTLAIGKEIRVVQMQATEGLWSDVLSAAQETLEASQRNNFLRGETESYWLLAQANRELGLAGASQFYLLGAEQGYENLNQRSQLGYVHWALGEYYASTNAPNKAIDYLNQARQELPNSEKEAWQVPTMELLAQLYEAIEDWTNTERLQNELLARYEAQGHEEKVDNTYLKLAQLAYTANNHQSMKRYTEELLARYEAKNDAASLSTAYNNLGFFFKRNNDLRTALDYFEQSVNLINSLNTKALYPRERAQIWVNAGVAYTNLGSKSRGEEFYRKALKLWEELKNEREQANVLNYLAASHYVHGKNLEALTAVTKAISLAEPLQARDILTTSYRILALVYQQGGNSTKQREYQQRYQSLVEEAQKASERDRQATIARQRELDQKETNLRQQLLAQRNLIQETERQSNLVRLQNQELALMSQKEELRQAELRNQQLEADRAQKALALAQSALEAEQQKNQVALLEQQQREQAAALREQELLEEQRQQEIAILEANNALQQTELLRQASIRRYTILGFMLGGFVLLVLSYSFWQKQRDNKKLKLQQEEIQEKNEELNTNQEVLQLTNRELEQKNLNITSSITYAQRIQEAMLPNTFTIREHLPNSFILFQPRDIVSGDFFWFAERDERIYIAAVDCTGHGVPGAFMSMIGTQLLNDLVNKNKLTQSNELLDALHDEVIQALKQDQTQNNDGMDMALCVIDKATHQVQFSGAKNPLVYIQNNEVEVIKGCRYPIGGVQISRRQPYQAHTVTVDAHTTFYIYSDGFQDQYGGPKDRKFMTRNFRELLHKVHHLPLAQQQKELEKALDEWRGQRSQVDDILVIGFHLESKENAASNQAHLSA